MTGWKIHNLKIYFLLNMGIFQCHVSFSGVCSPFCLVNLSETNGSLGFHREK